MWMSSFRDNERELFALPHSNPSRFHRFKIPLLNACWKMDPTWGPVEFVEMRTHRSDFKFLYLSPPNLLPPWLKIVSHFIVEVGKAATYDGL